MKRKEFLISSNNFAIIYLAEESIIENIDYTNDYNAIRVEFKPESLMTLEEANKIVNDNENQILSQIKSVIEQHPEVYQHFEYELRLSGGGSSECIFNHKQYLNEIEVRIPLRLKVGVN
jgi:hypothetical protein